MALAAPAQCLNAQSAPCRRIYQPVALTQSNQVLGSSRSWLKRARLHVAAQSASSSGAGAGSPKPDGLSKFDTPGFAAPRAGRSSLAATTPTPDGFALDISAGLAVLIAINCAVFAAAVLLKSPAALQLALYGGAATHWWQFLSSAFVHAHWHHLSRNLFLLYTFGRVLEPQLSTLGVWVTYLLCALGANLSAWWLLPVKAKTGGALLGLGATGGAMGVVLAALMVTARPSLKWVMAAAVAGQYALLALLTNPVPNGAAVLAQPAAVLPWWSAGNAPGGSSAAGVKLALKRVVVDTGMPTWFWGVAAAVVVVVALAKLPDPEASK